MSKSCFERDSPEGVFCAAELPVATEKETCFEPSPATFSASFSFHSDSWAELNQQGYDMEFDPPLESKYECPICLLALREAVQTPCGHRFCRGCIEKSIRDSGQKCPVDNESLQEDQLFLDNFAKREILSLTVLCPNAGCCHKTQLRQLDVHKQHCQFAMVPCPLCQDEVYRSQVEQHKAHQCPHRPVSCPDCMENFISQESVVHEQVCPLARVVCQYCSLELIRDQLASHYGTDCLKAPATCPFNGFGCREKMQRNDLAWHMQEFTQMHMRYMADHLRSQSLGRSAWPMQAWSCECGRERKNLEETAQQLEGRLVLQDHQLRELSVRASAQVAQLRELRERLRRLEERVQELQALQWCGVYVWRVMGFSTHLRSHEAGQPVVIHSPSFYTGHPGYKLCLRMHLQAPDATRWANHVSLYVHTMQGKFDGRLRWPMQGSIRLAVLDQADGDSSVVEVMETDPELNAFQRPSLPRNPRGFGYGAFVHLDRLRTSCYVRDDTLLLSCTVTLQHE